MLTFAAIAASVMVYWWIAATAFAKHLDAMNGREIAPGIRLHFATQHIEGFPFRLDVILDDVEIDVATSYGPLTWRAEHFAMHMLTYERSRQIFEAAGRQSLTWIDWQGDRHAFAFLPGTLQASAIESSGALVRFDLDIDSLSARDLSAARAQFHIRRKPGRSALDFVISGESMIFSRALRAGFGDQLRQLDVDGEISPAAPFISLLSGLADWRSAADHWRAQRGKVTIRTARLQWAKTAASGAGTLFLDGNRRVHGTITFDAQGNVLPFAWSGVPLETAGPLY